MELVLKGIKKSFGSKSVLKEASFSFEKGRIYGLLGRNGAGKTTLFNCLSGEIGFEEGTAALKDEMGREQPLTPERVGYVFSSPVLPDFLTGYEFIKFFVDLHKDKIKDSMSTDDYFKLLKLSQDDQHRLIKGYSHGMKNKLQLLLSLIVRPPVILLDEPLTSFDVVVAHEIKELIKSLKKDHIIIFSTHILQLATDMCDDLIILNEGRLEMVDSAMLKSKDFEAGIIELLKDDEANA